jgi:metal-responsive CopG/Arc/MetJ family transcriptional regulator
MAAIERHFNEARLVVACPQELLDLVDRAAGRRMTRRSEFVRQCILHRLLADKVAEEVAA